MEWQEPNHSVIKTIGKIKGRKKVALLVVKEKRKKSVYLVSPNLYLLRRWGQALYILCQTMEDQT